MFVCVSPICGTTHQNNHKQIIGISGKNGGIVGIQFRHHSNKHNEISLDDKREKMGYQYGWIAMLGYRHRCPCGWPRGNPL